MAKQIWIVTGPNRFGIATLRRKGIKYWWSLYHPTSINLLQPAAGSSGSVVGGALVGGLLLGGVGAVVGAMAGSKGGRSTFLVETTEGRTLTCQCRSNDFAGIYVAITKMMERGQIRKLR